MSVRARVVSSRMRLNSLKSPWIRPWRARSMTISIMASYSWLVRKVGNKKYLRNSVVFGDLVERNALR